MTMLFAAVHESVHGTFETFRDAVIWLRSGKSGSDRGIVELTRMTMAV
jgi:hypothetical protein